MELDNLKETPYEICKLPPNFRHSWQVVEPDYKITKPTVISFGGNFTFSGKQASGIANIVANLLGMKYKRHKNQIATFDDVDILSISYGKLRYAENTVLNDDEIVDLCNRLFVPLVLDKNGNKLPVEQAMINASMVTLFNHCYGSRAADEVMLEFMCKLKDIGYDAGDIHSIISQISAVSYAPMNNIHCGSHMKVYSYQDVVIPEGIIHGPKKLDGICVVKGFINDFTLWTSRLANGIKGLIDEHCVSRIFRNENWQHETSVGKERKYIGKNADAVSQIVAYVLSMNVATSIKNYYSNTFTPKPKVSELVDGCNDILKGFSKEDLAMNYD
ncbi:MAG: hypothetical protein IJW28_03985 [Clostridia bacterium]|nr:hypothetical protein [Clostridia bacterium]